MKRKQISLLGMALAVLLLFGGVQAMGQGTLYLSVNDSGMGSITEPGPNPSYSGYSANESEFVTASPNPGYAFWEWWASPADLPYNLSQNQRQRITFNADNDNISMTAVFIDENQDTDGDGLSDIWERTWGLEYRLLDENGQPVDPAGNLGDNGAYGNADSDFLPALTNYPIDQLDSSTGYMPKTTLPFHNLLEANGFDETYGTADDPGTDPGDADTDDDGLPDGWEYYFWGMTVNGIITNGNALDWTTFTNSIAIDTNEILNLFNPLASNGSAEADPDADGLNNAEEYAAGTSPIEWDTDGDGMPDGWEAAYEGINPLSGDAAGNPDGDYMAYVDQTMNIQSYSLDAYQPETYPMTKDGRVFRHHELYVNSFPTNREEAYAFGGYGFDPRVAWGLEYTSAETEQNDEGTSVFKREITPFTVEYSNYEEYRLAAYRRLNFATTNGVNRDTTEIISFDEIFAWTTNPTTNDTDADGIHDGWELYTGLDPLDGEHAELGDFTDLQEFQCQDLSNGPPMWLNKFWPTDPNDDDTDGDLIDDEDEGDPKFQYMNGVKVLNTSAKCYEGGGLNPCGVDTDSDFLPDKWEYTFAFDESPVEPGQAGAGMDPTVQDATGLEYDYDMDRLENYQEYMVQAMPLFQYADLYSGVGGTNVFYNEETSEYEIDIYGVTEGQEFTDFEGNTHSFDASTYVNYELSSKRPPYYKVIVQSLNATYYGFPIDYTHWFDFSVYWPKNGAFDNPIDGNVLFDGEYAGPMGGREWDWNLWWIYNPAAVSARYAWMPPLPPHTFNSPPERYASTYPTKADTDGDDMDDFYEIFHFMSPILGNANLIYDALNSENVGMSPVRESEIDSDWDFEKYPWNAGHQQADFDGDGIPNFEESLEPSVGAPQFMHSDPSPAWVADYSHYRSWARLYYAVKNDAFYFNRGTFGSEGPTEPSYWFNFEINEGYDTDNDNISDAQERISQSAWPGVTDPVDPMSPLNRRALYLDGASAARTKNPSVTPPEDAWLNSLRNFTVEAWVRPERINSQSSQVIVERAGTGFPVGSDLYDAGTRYNFRLALAANGAPYILFSGNGGVLEEVYALAPSSKALQTNQWYHLAGVYDGEEQQLKLYIDGELAASQGASLNPFWGWINANGEHSFIGCSLLVGASDARPSQYIHWNEFTSFNQPQTPAPLLGSYFKGWIDEVRVWAGARSESEIRADRFTSYTWDELKLYATNNAPGRLIFNYTFNNLTDPDYSASGEYDANRPSHHVAPYGFDYTVAGTWPELTPYIVWWNGVSVRSTVYTNYAYLPWIENEAFHYAIDPPLDSPMTSNAVPNSSNPYGFMYFHPPSTPYSEFNRDFEAHPGGGLSERFASFPLSPRDAAYYSDLLPLYGAEADQDVVMWDYKGSGQVGQDADNPGDTDGDGMADWWEIANGLDPKDASDADGDIDGDGLSNLAESQAGTDPRSIYSVPGSKTDYDLDSDGDGIINGLEVDQFATNPGNPDTDDDGYSDGAEINPLVTNGGLRVSSPTDATSPYDSKAGQLAPADMLIVGTAPFGFGSTNALNNLYFYSSNGVDGDIAGGAWIDSIVGNGIFDTDYSLLGQPVDGDTGSQIFQGMYSNNTGSLWVDEYADGVYNKDTLLGADYGLTHGIGALTNLTALEQGEVIFTYPGDGVLHSIASNGLLAVADGITTNFSGAMNYFPLQDVQIDVVRPNGTLVYSTILDDGAGDLTLDGEDIGNITYFSGAWELNFDSVGAIPGAGDILVPRFFIQTNFLSGPAVANLPIKPGSVVINAQGEGVFADDGFGILYASDPDYGGVGGIDYVSGNWVVTGALVKIYGTDNTDFTMSYSFTNNPASTDVNGSAFQNTPVIPGSVSFYMAGDVSFIDNGSGSIVSIETGETNGTINYASGAWSFDPLEIPMSKGADFALSVDYRYAKQTSGELRDLVTNFTMRVNVMALADPDGDTVYYDSDDSNVDPIPLASTGMPLYAFTLTADSLTLRDLQTNGILYASNTTGEASGHIDYETGAWDATFSVAPSNKMTAFYYVDRNVPFYEKVSWSLEGLPATNDPNTYVWIDVYGAMDMQYQTDAGGTPNYRFGFNEFYSRTKYYMEAFVGGRWLPLDDISIGLETPPAFADDTPVGGGYSAAVFAKNPDNQLYLIRGDSIDLPDANFVYKGLLNRSPVIPGSLIITFNDINEEIRDLTGSGILTNDIGGSGKIDYTSGAYTFMLGTNVEVAGVATYEYSDQTRSFFENGDFVWVDTAGGRTKIYDNETVARNSGTLTNGSVGSEMTNVWTTGGSAYQTGDKLWQEISSAFGSDGVFDRESIVNDGPMLGNGATGALVPNAYLYQRGSSHSGYQPGDSIWIEMGYFTPGDEVFFNSPLSIPWREADGTDRFALSKWTVESMVKLSTTNETGALVKRTTITDEVNFEIGVQTNIPYARFTTEVGNDIYVSSGIQLAVGSWTHVAASFDPDADSLQIYVNGQLIANRQTLEECSTGLDGLTVTARKTGDVTVGGEINGCIDELRIWNSVRTDSEISTWYNKHLYDLSSIGSGHASYLAAMEAELEACHIFDDGQNEAVVNLKDGAVHSYGAEDWRHRLDWDYAITNIAFCDDAGPVAGLTDTDGDGLPDWWEALFFGGNVSPTADADGDGVNNLNEYLNDTNPKAANINNIAPTVDAGTNRTTTSSMIYLDATVSDDGNPGGGLSYSWTVASGPGDVIFLSPMAEDTWAYFTNNGLYELTLTAHDGALQGSDSLQVTVNVSTNSGGGPGPMLAISPSGWTKTVALNQPMSFDVTGTSTSAAQVSLTASNLPSGSSFAPNPATGTPTATGTFSWTPSSTGEFDVVFNAADVNGSVQQSATIRVVQYDENDLLGLFMTMYVEGATDTEKAIEVQNNTGLDLPSNVSHLTFQINTTNSQAVVFVSPIYAPINAGDSVVIVPTNASPAFVSSFAGKTVVYSPRVGLQWFDGDDAVMLRAGTYVSGQATNPILDRVGQILANGKVVDPGSGYWGTVDDNTKDHTMTRKVGITQGDTDAYDPFDPSIEWDFTGSAGFEIEELSFYMATGANSISFPSSVGQTYSVYYSTNLFGANPWMLLETGIPGSNTVTTIQDTNLTTSIKLYRIATP